MLPPEFAEAWQCIAHLHKFSQTLKHLGSAVDNEQSDLDSRDQPNSYSQQLQLEKERRVTAESELHQAQQLLKRSYGQLVDELLQTTQQLHSQTQRIQQLEEELAAMKNTSKAPSPQSQSSTHLLHGSMQAPSTHTLNAYGAVHVSSASRHGSSRRQSYSNYSSPEDKPSHSSRPVFDNTTTPTKPHQVLQQTPLIIPGSGSKSYHEASYTSSTLISPDGEQDHSNSQYAARRVAELLGSLQLPTDNTPHPTTTTTAMHATPSNPRDSANDLHVQHPTGDMEQSRRSFISEQGRNATTIPEQGVSAFGFGAQQVAQTRLERVAAALSAVRGSSAALPHSNKQVGQGSLAANGHSPSPSYPPACSATATPDNVVSSSFFQYGYSTQRCNSNAHECVQRDTGLQQGTAKQTVPDSSNGIRETSQEKQESFTGRRAQTSSNPGAAPSHSIRFSSNGGYSPGLLKSNNHSPMFGVSTASNTQQQQHLDDDTDALRYLRSLRQQHSLPSYQRGRAANGGLQSSASDALPAAQSHASISTAVPQQWGDQNTNYMDNTGAQYVSNTWHNPAGNPAVGSFINVAPPSAQASLEGQPSDASELSDWETVGESEEQQASSPATAACAESALYQQRHNPLPQSDKALYTTAASAPSNHAIPAPSTLFMQPNGQIAACYDSQAATRVRSSLASFSESSHAVAGRLHSDGGWRGQAAGSTAACPTPVPAASRESSGSSMRDGANSPSLEMSSDELFRSIKKQLASLQATFPQVHI